MKAFIVGYYDAWANDYLSIIVGYYIKWRIAVDVAKQFEQDNIIHHQGLRTIYIVEVEENKTQSFVRKDSMSQWIDDYVNYRIKTIDGKTIFTSNTGKEFTVILNQDDGWTQIKPRHRKRLAKPI